MVMDIPKEHLPPFSSFLTGEEEEEEEEGRQDDPCKDHSTIEDDEIFDDHMFALQDDELKLMDDQNQLDDQASPFEEADQQINGHPAPPTNLSCSQPNTPLIKLINSSTSTLLCSGQVIRNLADVAKELIENSLDSGADAIEVICHEHGKIELTIHDNGSGIHENDFHLLARRGCTSKLRDFDDLKTISTMGFRGEALYSIASISHLEIATRHSDSNVGSRLFFDSNGKITRREPLARMIGTTVTVKQLFHNLPVRKRTFHQSAKKDYQEMLRHITTYAIGYVNLKFSCVNYVENKRFNDIGLSKTSSLRENIIQMYGSNQLMMATEFIKHSIDQSTAVEYALNERQLSFQQDILITGYVSNRNKTIGRQTIDRHFFFINNRPVYYKKMSKLISTIYKLYNGSHCPFVLLHITVPGHQVDINLTPDKRTFHMHIEKLLFAIIKCSLVQMYEKSSANVSVPVNESIVERKRALNEPILEIGQPSKVSRNDDDDDDDDVVGSSYNNIVPSKKGLNSIQYEFARTLQPELSPEDVSKMDNQREDNIREPQRSSKPFVRNIRETISSKPTQDTRKSAAVDKTPKISHFVETRPRQLFDSDQEASSTLACPPQTMEVESTSNQSRPLPEPNFQSLLTYMEAVRKKNQTISSSSSQPTSRPTSQMATTSFASVITSAGDNQSTLEPMQYDQEPSNEQEQEEVIIAHDKPCTDLERREVLMDVDWNEVTANYANHLAWLQNHSYDNEQRFKAPIRKSQNDDAEQELRKELKKSDFTSMDIVGQFAKGFIVARKESDVFIIDQHASDEKYHYERLFKSCSLQTQPLVMAEKLNFPAYQETLMINNQNVFDRNGFKLLIDECAEPGQRVKLASKPCSKNYVFSRDDVEEIVNDLAEQGELAPNYRPSKVKSLLAYGACHSAKRIGDTLTRNEMRTIVDNMSKLDHPWTCAHGRPTIRHLTNLKANEIKFN